MSLSLLRKSVDTGAAILRTPFRSRCAGNPAPQFSNERFFNSFFRNIADVTTIPGRSTTTTGSRSSSSSSSSNSGGGGSGNRMKGILVLTMPQCSPTMTSGKLTKWHVSPGNDVAAYDLVLDLSAHGLHDTDAGNSSAAVDMEIETLDDGTLCSVFHHAGDVVPINMPIAVLCDEPDNVEFAKSLLLESHAAELAIAPRAMWQAYKKTHSEEGVGKCM